MQVTETRNEGLTREFSVRIGASDIAEKRDAKLSEIGRDVTLPGFRPGKAPLTLLMKRYGKAVMSEILEAAVNDSSSQAIAERGLRPAMQPRIEITSFEDGADLEYSMQLELMPEIEPADFSKIKLERIVIEVSNNEVDEALDRIASQNRRTEPVAKPRKAATGDVVVINFVGRVDGGEFPGGAGKEHHLELGSGQFIPGFEEQLTGASAGDHVDVKVTFPDDYSESGMAGKSAEFDVDVTEIREYAESPIDDALGQAMGFDNLVKLREAVTGNLEREYSEMSRTALKRGLLDKLSELHEFEVPQGMLEAEFAAIWKQFEDAREKGQIDEDDVDRSDEELEKEYRAIAERRVRLGLLLSEVGRLNNIEVSQDEVNKAIMAQTQRYPGHQREVAEHFQNNPQAQAELRAPLFENKVTDFVLELADVTERRGAMEDLLQEPGAAADGGDKNGGDKKKKAGGKSTKKAKPAAVKKPAAAKKAASAKKAAAPGKKAAAKGKKS